MLHNTAGQRSAVQLCQLGTVIVVGRYLRDGMRAFRLAGCSSCWLGSCYLGYCCGG